MSQTNLYRYNSYTLKRCATCKNWNAKQECEEPTWRATHASYLEGLINGNKLPKNISVVTTGPNFSCGQWGKR